MISPSLLIIVCILFYLIFSLDDMEKRKVYIPNKKAPTIRMPFYEEGKLTITINKTNLNI